MVIERIFEIIHHQRLTQTEFCNRTQIAQSTLASTRTRKGNVSEEIIVAVLLAFPNVNPIWLLLGYGEMWLDAPNPVLVSAAEKGDKVVEKFNSESETELQVLRERVRGLEMVLEGKDKEIEAKDKLIKLLER